MKKNDGNPTEADITKQVRSLLSIKGIFHWKQWQGPMSQPKGVSDIIGIYQGKMLAIEVKRPGGKLTDHQQAFIDRVNDEGGIAFVVYSLDDLMSWMRDEGLIRGG